MKLLQFGSILNQSAALLGTKANGLLRPTAVSLRFMTTEEKKHAKLAKKQAKKDARKASEPAVPDYFKERAVLWSTLKKKYNEQLAANATQTIKIGLADGTVVDGTAGKTTPFEVAQGIGSGLASDSIVAKVNDVLWDMERPLEADCEIDLLKFEEPEAKQTFWYSTACLLGEALERVYGVESNGLLCGVGVIDKGFYADIHLKEGAVDLAVVQQRLEKIFLNKAPFEQIEASKEDALQLFAYNLFQKRLIEASTTERIGIYRSGQAIGVKSHTNVRHPKKIKVYKLMKTEAAFWNNNKDAEPVQRVYGISFPSDSMLADFVKK